LKFRTLAFEFSHPALHDSARYLDLCPVMVAPVTPIPRRVQVALGDLFMRTCSAVVLRRKSVRQDGGCPFSECSDVIARSIHRDTPLIRCLDGSHTQVS
jgi:hypothetical protein